MALKPICVKCRMFYKPERNGIAFLEGMPKGNGAPPGNKAPERWRPYKLWVGDLWKCRGCNHEIIVGALNHVAEHYEHGFEEKVSQRGATIQINDC